MLCCFMLSENAVKLFTYSINLLPNKQINNTDYNIPTSQKIMKDQPTQSTINPQKQSGSNESQSSFESVINELSVEESKFCSIFIENCELFEVHVNSFEVINSHHLLGFGSRFITYKLKIVTDHLCYYVEKRYRDFLALYQKISMFYTSKIMFPKKTHFRSKICPFLTESRRKVFDDLLSQIISLRHSNKSAISQLIAFLGIRDHYHQLGLNQSVFLSQNIVDYIKQDKAYLFSHFLRHQLLKIQIVPNKSLRSLSKLYKLLCSANRNYIKVDDLRAMLIGANRVPGLLQIALSNTNEVVSLTFLKQIKKLFDPQICPYSEAFKRILETSPAHCLCLNSLQLLQYEQFTTIYFQLVDLYLKFRLNHENTRTDNLIKEILKKQAIQKYVEWKTGKRQRDSQIRRKTKLEMIQLKPNNYSRQSKIYENIDQLVDESEQNCNLQFKRQVQCIFENQSKSQNKYQILFKDNYSCSYCQVSVDRRFMHFMVVSKKGFNQVRQIVQKWSHNKLVSDYYPPNILTQINKIFFNFQGKSLKLFQFQEKKTTNNQILQQTQMLLQKIEGNHTKNRLTIQLSPPKQLKTVHSFFYRLQVKQIQQNLVSVQILYFFHRQKVRKMFEQQLLGKNTFFIVEQASNQLQLCQNLINYKLASLLKYYSFSGNVICKKLKKQ